MSPSETVNNRCFFSDVKQRNLSITQAAYNRQIVPRMSTADANPGADICSGHQHVVNGRTVC